MASIEELEKEVADLKQQLRDAEARLAAARCAAAGVALGDLVVSKDGLTYKVTRIDPWPFGTWVRGVTKIKDGAWGRRERRLYSDWTKVE